MEAVANSFDMEPTETHVDTDSPAGRHRATVTFDSGNGGTFMISFDAPQREAGKSSSRSDEEEEGDGGVMAVPSVRSPGGLDSGLRSTEKSETVLQDYRNTQRKIVILPDDAQSPVSREELLIPIKDLVDSDSDSSTGPTLPSRYIPRAPRGQTSKEKPTKDRAKFSRSKSTGAAVTTPNTTPRAKSTERRTVSKSQEVTTRLTSSTRVTRSSGTRSRGGSVNRDTSTSDGPYSESDSTSIRSSGTDYSEPSPRLTRKASGGKGTVPVARPNRTFALRRQKLEGDSESNRSDSSTLTPRSSRPNSTSLDTPGSPKLSRASSRSRSGSRTRPLSAQEVNRSTKTDASLGQKIVDKSRDNQRVSNSSSRDVSSRYNRSVSCKTPLSSPRAKSEAKDIRPRSGSQRTVTGSTPSLAVSVNRSQPNSRSNSPRTQELNAWKRRKSYDPRQAVAEAKATKQVTKSKSSISDQDKSAPSVSSLSSEESGNLDDSCGENSRTEDIIKLSTEIYKNLAAMSRENENEEADILMVCIIVRPCI